ncbi:ERF family protein [Clostridium paraputrificum]|uniref:ERF family protein n=1 Tax=Clostridium paraputrificum TaxID=29363 RepID=UPI001898B98B|nr:ERF family protein [Clostridium paraputrificum]MDB2123695.1 ERF family protein [Clostridium paraputrificum]
MADEVTKLKEEIETLKQQLEEYKQPKLNIFQKIQKARVELQKKDIKKTGVNKNSNYKYFELEDFMPYVNEICLEIGLYTEIQYTNEKATLYVRDSDNTDDFRKWDMPIEVAMLKGCSAIQNIGGTQKYARRYLYMLAFEISESDTIDGGEVDTEKEEGFKKIGKVQISVIRGILEETQGDEEKFCNHIGVDRLEDICNKDYPFCLKELEKKKVEYYKKQKMISEQKKQQEQFQKELEAKQEDFEF